MSAQLPPGPVPPPHVVGATRPPSRTPDILITIIIHGLWLLGSPLHLFLFFPFIGGDCVDPAACQRTEGLPLLFALVPPALFIVTATVSIILLVRKRLAWPWAAGGLLAMIVFVIVMFTLLWGG